MSTFDMLFSLSNPVRYMNYQIEAHEAEFWFHQHALPSDVSSKSREPGIRFLLLLQSLFDSVCRVVALCMACARL